MANVTVEQCSCKHEYQDEKYGKGMRVFTLGKGSSVDRPKKTCTVCGKVK